MSRITTTVLLLSLALPSLAIAERCKEGQVEDPATGKCKDPAKPHHSSSHETRPGMTGPSAEDQEESANLERHACDVRCEQQRLTCREDGSKCETLNGLCKEECDTRYLERLPPKRRKEILQARADEVQRKKDEAQHALEEKQKAEQARRDEELRQAQIARARRAMESVEEKARDADRSASEGCTAAQRMKMAELPCTSPEAQRAVQSARVALMAAQESKNTAAASAAADKVEAALTDAKKAHWAVLAASEPARQAAARDDERIADEARAAERRLSAQRDAEQAALQAEQERRRAEDRARFDWNTDRDTRKSRRVAGYALIGVGGAMAILGGAFLSLEGGQYDKVRAGGLAAPGDVTGAISLGHTYDALAITSFSIGGAMAAVAVPLILANLDRGEFRAGISLGTGASLSGVTLSGSF